MEIASSDDLFQAASMQPGPQRLLFVFAAVELTGDATPAQHAAFEVGQGGALVPLMCVDKTPQELGSFEDLLAEAHQFTAPGHDWAMVFAAAMSGTLSKPSTSADAEAPLQRMVDSINGGPHSAYIPFDRQGQPVRFG
ncbi:MAG: ribonucleotide reductase subunit alpha [Burkholderiaceae bacterium]|nr:ribonucleotide reductase subunit alpha [Burkholderiaceae bacterium]